MSEYKITTALITTMVVTWLTTASGALADTLITNARIIDGMGSPAMLGSVRLSGDRITALGDLAADDADHIIDANGLVLAPGMIADLVLFNPDTVTDRATTGEPFAPSEGIHSVWVAGERVLKEGEVSETFPGRVIRRTSAQP